MESSVTNETMNYTKFGTPKIVQLREVISLEGFTILGFHGFQVCDRSVWQSPQQAVVKLLGLTHQRWMVQTIGRLQRYCPRQTQVGVIKISVVL